MSHTDTKPKNLVTITVAELEEHQRLQTAMIHASNLLDALHDTGALKDFPNCYEAYKEKFNATDLSKWLAEIHSRVPASK